MLLAFIFLLAGYGKLLNLPRTQNALASLGAPRGHLRFFGAALPAAEILAAVLLVFPQTRWYGATLAVTLLAIFLAALANALRSGMVADCNCFGREKPAPVTRSSIIRNCLLLALGFTAVASGQAPSSITHSGGSSYLIPLLLTALAGMATAVFLRNARVDAAAQTPDGNIPPFQWPLEQ